MVIFGGVVDMKERENDTRLELSEGHAQPISHNVFRDFVKLTISKAGISDVTKLISRFYRAMAYIMNLSKSFPRNLRPILRP
jgi:hypothetical protein